MKVTLGLCLLLYIACVQGADQITEAPEVGKALKLGGSAEKMLSCTANGTFTNFIWKLKDGDRELCKADDQTADCLIKNVPAELYETKPPNYTLHVKTNKTVTYEHAGSYSCELTTSAFAVEGPKIGDVTVVAENPVCETDDVYLPSSKEATIQCTQSYRGLEIPVMKIDNSTDTVETDGKGSEDGGDTREAALTITPTTKAYVCSSTTGQVTPVTGSCNINVKVYNEIIDTKPKEQYVAKVGDTAVIDCKVNDKDYVEVKWYKDADNTVLCTGKNATATDEAASCPDSEKYELDTINKHNLKVKKVTAESAGLYTCKVKESDTIEGEEYSGNLVVVEKAAVCTKGEVKEEKMSISCAINYKGPSSIAQKLLKWTEDSADKADGYSVSRQEDTWLPIVKNKTDASPTKKYTCTVTNGAETLGCTIEPEGSGASALNAKFLQATFLSLAVVFVMNRCR